MQLDGPPKTESCVERKEMSREFRIAMLGRLAQVPLNGVLDLTSQANLICVRQNVIVKMQMDQEQETMESGVD